MPYLEKLAIGLPRLWTAISADVNAFPEGSGESNSLLELGCKDEPFPTDFQLHQAPSSATVVEVQG